ncbi:fimbria/pilus outer membrane usher protein [Pusillimonas sp. ANT_WB101]|uniref:fimbria/pilus outer membrane usher protein n=1 Tax=Pusillimonas sp. ANT_WB101 TaxID=2597356 RepID=UPI0011EFF5EA|nr:fimbria/pilus outer membrane usher protein [Pusillimonas sp. ANT_WB101]KAA0911469.1 fimbrial biogenesis outer membrane usher protein [Pusillimonas sp. ANT_WB101]
MALLREAFNFRKTRPSEHVGLTLAALLSAFSLPVKSASLPPPPEVIKRHIPSVTSVALAGSPKIPSSIDLYIDVYVNQTPRGIYPFTFRESELWVLPKVLKDIGIRSMQEGDVPVRINGLDGITARYDEEYQRLFVEGSMENLALPLTTAGLQDAEYTPASASPGALLNYDLYGMRQSDHVSSLSLFSEIRAFAGNTVASSTSLVQSLHGVPQYSGVNTVRLDTSVSTSLQKSMLTFTAGDTYTRSLNWTRSTRIGGIQFGRNFNLQPYRITTPLPELFGSATVPSDIELFVNGLKQYSGQVPAGPFQLNAMPGISGAGNAQIVMTDALGRMQTLDFSLYDTQRLLKQGLTDWSVELGAVRKQYGLKSFSYGSDPAVSGTLRHGLSQTFTAETHFESTRGLVNAGLGGVWAPGQLGVFSGSLTSSRYEHRQGTQWSAGYDWSGSSLNAGINALGSNDNYRDVPSLYDAKNIRSQMRAHMGFSHPVLGNTGLSYLKLQYQGEEALRYGNLFWFKSLGQRASLSLNVNQNLDRRRDRSVYLGLTISLDGDISMSAGAQRDGDTNALTLDANKTTPSEGGWGWRVNARNADQQSGGQGQAEYMGRYGRATAGALSVGDLRQVYGGATGAVVFMGGQTFASRRVDDGFAVVSTSGVADVPVLVGNRPVGLTNDMGYLLVTPIHAYQRNKIGIDALSLPADFHIDKVTANSTPTFGAGTMVRFEIKQVRAASITVHGPDGTPLPVGSPVRALKTGEVSMVGFDGLVYLENLRNENTLQIDIQPENDAETSEAHSVGRCKVDFSYTGQGRSVASLGPYTCTPLEVMP